MTENKKYPDRAADVPVTQKMLYGVRDELKSFVRSEIRKVNSKIHNHEARFDQIDGQLEELKAEMHRLGVIIEEQNAKNNVVLDGLSVLFHRQERVENRLEEVQRYIQQSK